MRNYVLGVRLEETEFTWYNREWKKWDDAFTHVLTHSLHYGSAVFEGIRCYNTDKGPAVFRLKDHNERLFRSAEIIGMKNSFTKKEMFEASKKVITKNNLKEAYIRPLLFYGYTKMGLDSVGLEAEGMIAALPWGAYLGEEAKVKGISLKISQYSRHFPVPELNHAKVSGFYANSTLAKMDAIKDGYKEALMLDLDGNVAECTGENIFIVKDKKLITPTTKNALRGITRDSVIEIAKSQGIVVEEKTITKEELFGADECFITGTAAEITPVTSVDGKIISASVGETTVLVQKIFEETIHGKRPEFIDWLDFVDEC